MARPIAWDKEKKEAACIDIFERVSNGESIRKILDNADRYKYPANNTFLDWIRNDTELNKRYACACEDRADKIFEEILEIADDKSQDTIKQNIGDGIEIEVENREFVNRSKVRIDARKWVLAKMQPKKYGDKLDIEQTIKMEQPLF